MVNALRSRGARVGYAFYPGGHDWSVWYPRLNTMLELASGEVSRSPALIVARHHRHATSYRPLRRPDRARLGTYRRHGAGLYASSRHNHAPPSDAGALAGYQPPVATVSRPQPNQGRLLGALLLALVSAALINLGFVLQHRGLAQGRRTGRDGFGAALLNRTWLSGQAVGWIGFAGQIVAVALAPLTLVQAFAAGSLAITVPLVARTFGHRVGRAQLVAVVVVALSLASLPIGFSGGHNRLQGGALIGAALIALIAASGLGLTARTTTRAIAAGLFYGVADAAIKADALGVRAHGGAALLSGWTILAALATFGGFLAFQHALRGEDAVNPITLMNAFTAVIAAALGIVAFGESLGTSPAASIGHVMAIALVLACVRPLARAQQQLTASAGAPDPHGSFESGLAREPGGRRPHEAPLARPRTRAGIIAPVTRALVLAVGAALTVVALLLAALAGVGLLYGLRGLHWFAIGPRVPDALPLLQLAGFDGQPLGRVLVGWLLAGAVLGVALIRLRPSRRLLVVAVFGAAILLFASDASFALARNLRLDQVLLNREPPLGPWVECLLLAVGSVLPRPISRARVLAIPRPRMTRLERQPA
jgi:hypothetical protein